MKLTNKVKELIEREATGAVFNDRAKEVRIALNGAIAKMIAVKPDKYVPAFQIPDFLDKYIQKSSSVRINFWNYPGKKQDMAIKLPVSYALEIYSSYVETFKYEELAGKLTEFDAYLKLDDEMAEFISELRQVLASCTTDKQLIETAPELEKFIPKNPETGNCQLVAVETVNRLRATLGGTK